MSIHKWRRRPTKHFGEVWVPFAQIDIQSLDGRFRSLALQIDSGAVISLLRRSAGELLGLPIAAGHKVELGGIGGAKTDAYVHELTTRFASTTVLRVPFAIAQSESVPNLLGRLGVFDQLQVDFDATLEETRITAPWLDNRPDRQERRIYEFLLHTERDILGRWDASSLPEPADTVARCLFDRMGQLFVTGAGLRKLHRPFAGALIVRAMLETALEFEFLMGDPRPRAQLYVDFAHITRHLHSLAVAENPTGPISQAIAASQERVEGQQRNKQEFERVRHKFLVPSKPGKQRLWEHWYCMNTFDLAKTLKREGEYRLIYKGCSRYVHGDPLATVGSSQVSAADPGILFIQCVGYYARLLLLVADRMRLVLTNEQHTFLKQLATGFS